MYPHPQISDPKVGILSQPPQNPGLFYSEPQFIHENSPVNPHQVKINPSPSPTAENLVPTFINEENTPEEKSKLGRLISSFLIHIQNLICNKKFLASSNI